MSNKPELTDFEFWNIIARSAKEIPDISNGTVRVWKARKCIPSSRVVPIFLALQGTEDEISIEELHKRSSKA